MTRLKVQLFVLQWVTSGFLVSKASLPMSPSDILTSIKKSCKGAVLASHNGTTHMICVENTTQHYTLAAVWCHELGCGSPISTHLDIPVNNTSMPFLEVLNCKGSEPKVSDCQLHGGSEERCNSSKVLVVDCLEDSTVKEENIDNETGRLVGGRTKCDGYVEILSNGSWSLACSSGFKENEGAVLCRQVGCEAEWVSITPTKRKQTLGQSQHLPFEKIKCIGNESSVSVCQYIENDNCTPAYNVYLTCNTERPKENWLTWLALMVAAIIITVFCFVRAMESLKCCHRIMGRQHPSRYKSADQQWRCCNGNTSPVHKRRRRQPELQIMVDPVEDKQSTLGSPVLREPTDINALLAPHGFQLNNSITPPPSYMNALKVISKPLDNTQTPPPSYLEALKVLSRPVIVHVPADLDNEEEELLAKKSEPSEERQ
ncbi:scavenger receptor cysteine-rich type 1 protein M130-like [Erpetoichthys calabaricus]|uniref:scavenger receptor cysteine-rich type 1 protein M130-like n=1 Tax=Erpetoichthys calabaricus TaxID=27687 RepID=UPI00109FF4E9|nr:scavenger receptor cysteine-rich type 1 protein M130-like [Erpetoichthys calabaricus]